MSCTVRKAPLVEKEMQTPLARTQRCPASPDWTAASARIGTAPATGRQSQSPSSNTIQAAKFGSSEQPGERALGLRVGHIETIFCRLTAAERASCTAAAKSLAIEVSRLPLRYSPMRGDAIATSRMRIIRLTTPSRSVNPEFLGPASAMRGALYL